MIDKVVNIDEFIDNLQELKDKNGWDTAICGCDVHKYLKEQPGLIERMNGIVITLSEPIKTRYVVNK